jgi:hypothetical protein
MEGYSQVCKEMSCERQGVGGGGGGGEGGGGGSLLGVILLFYPRNLHSFSFNLSSHFSSKFYRKFLDSFKNKVQY